MPSRSLVVALGTAAASLSACSPRPPAEHYGFVAQLGRDTISLENVTREGDRLVIEGVDRFPPVRRRHTEILLGPDGGIRHLVMDIRTPSGPEGNRLRRVEVDVDRGTVHMTKRGASDSLTRDFPARDTIVMAHVPQMYSLYDLYFSAARKHVAAPRGDDTVRMRQFYIDREFDRFSMHDANVRLLAGNRAEIWHDWLAGIGEATLDGSGHLLAYSGARTTYKMTVARTDGRADIDSVAARFEAVEAGAGSVRQLSVRDSARAAIGAAQITVDYGRPLMRGRVLLGDVVPFDRVWRTGANAATQLEASAPLVLGGVAIAAGRYTLWTVPHRDGVVELIVNRQSGQWGTQYDPRQDVGRTRMTVDSVPVPVEAFTIAVTPAGDGRGVLAMSWGRFRWTVPLSVGTVAARK